MVWKREGSKGMHAAGLICVVVLLCCITCFFTIYIVVVSHVLYALPFVGMVVGSSYFHTNLFIQTLINEVANFFVFPSIVCTNIYALINI